MVEIFMDLCHNGTKQSGDNCVQQNKNDNEFGDCFGIFSPSVTDSLCCGYGFYNSENIVVLPVNFWLKVYDGIFFGWWGELGSFFSLGEFNLVPAIVKIMKGELVLGSWVKEMLVGNILMFVPFGFFLPFITKKVSQKNIFLIAAVVPLVVEVFQLLLGRSFDVDDLICNFVGIIAGYFSAFALKSIKNRAKEENNYGT